MKSTTSQQRAVGAGHIRNNSSTMPGNERASFKGGQSSSNAALASTSENVKAINLPNSKGMNKPPTCNTSHNNTGGPSGQKDRKFGRQLSTNNGEAGGVSITLQVMPDTKCKPNVSVIRCTVVQPA